MSGIANTLGLIALMALLGACQKLDTGQTLPVQVVNRSQQSITQGRFSTATGQGSMDFTVDKDGTRDLRFSFGQVAKTDGSYRITCQLSGSASTLTKEFGYYTNGYPTDRSLLLTVYADSIAVKSVLKSY